MAKSAKSEMDALFSKVKTKKTETKKPGTEKTQKKISKRNAAPKGSASDPLGAGPKNSVQRKYTEEGWPIYTEEELNLCSGGGDTALCPFDCECCF